LSSGASIGNFRAQRSAIDFSSGWSRLAVSAISLSSSALKSEFFTLYLASPAAEDRLRFSETESASKLLGARLDRVKAISPAIFASLGFLPD
jgi:hypothetical protein